MRASNIGVDEADTHCELRAEISGGRLPRPFVLRYRFPAELKSTIDPRRGDAFLGALLLPAMRTGEMLEIEGSVSPKILRSIETIQAIFCCWDRTLERVPVRTHARRRLLWPIGRPRRVGLFFSLGVDSTFSLFKNVHGRPGNAPPITELIVVNGFDLASGGEGDDMFRQVLRNSALVARETHTRVIPVWTNLRELTEQYAEWGGFSHGPAMASVVLALEGALRIINIASGHSYDSIFPAGTHPLLDPLWSTEHLRFVHDGCETTRTEKVRSIARFPVVLRTLRVCWLNTGGAYNCARCNKCLGTMIRLQIVGKLSESGTFPHRIDLDLVRTMTITAVGQRPYTQALVGELGNSDADRLLKDALMDCLAGYEPALELQLSQQAMQLKELQDWAGQIETGKQWLEAQRQAWQKTAEDQGRVIAELQATLESLRATHQHEPGSRVG